MHGGPVLCTATIQENTIHWCLVIRGQTIPLLSVPAPPRTKEYLSLSHWCLVIRGKTIPLSVPAPPETRNFSISHWCLVIHSVPNNTSLSTKVQSTSTYFSPVPRNTSVSLWASLPSLSSFQDIPSSHQHHRVNYNESWRPEITMNRGDGRVA